MRQSFERRQDDPSQALGIMLTTLSALDDLASDKVAHSVKVKLANARANFRREWGNAPAQILRAVRKMAEAELDEPDREPPRVERRRLCERWQGGRQRGGRGEGGRPRLHADRLLTVSCRSCNPTHRES